MTQAGRGGSLLLRMTDALIDGFAGVDWHNCPPKELVKSVHNTQASNEINISTYFLLQSRNFYLILRKQVLDVGIFGLIETSLT